MKFTVADDEHFILEETCDILRELYPDSELHGFDNAYSLLDYMEQNNYHPDCAFLDIDMPGISGLQLAVRIKQLSMETKIVFVTGYCEYAITAVNEAYARGYLLKPVKKEDVRRTVERLMEETPVTSDRLRVHCFGNFEVFHRGIPIKFDGPKSKELFALLVDREGAALTSKEIAAYLYEDKPYDRKTANFIAVAWARLKSSLSAVGIRDVLVSSYNSKSINVSAFDCDYYSFLKGDPAALNLYKGEYMTQYGWAEDTNAEIFSKIGNTPPISSSHKVCK